MTPEDISFLDAQKIFFRTLKKRKEYQGIIKETFDDLVPDDNGEYSVCIESIKDRLWEEVFPDVLNYLANDAENEIIKLTRSISG